MSTTQGTAPAGQIYLLAIRGTLALPTLEATRTMHNETAGAPANVAAARALGDLSHMVYVPLDHGQVGGEGGAFLILDQWNNLDGLQQFFANAQVQEQAGRLFSQRDPVVWAPADGFVAYHCPAPFDRTERLVAIVRGVVRSRAEAQAAHNALVGGTINKARAAGNVSHEAYVRLAPADSSEALEFFAVDVWYDGAGMRAHYEDPEFERGFSTIFAAPPSASVWVHPAGSWVEW
jgi:quinol monooxygenase YgiN